MSEFSNNNRGQIWGNQKKRSDRDPDFTGSLDVGGIQYWVSAWKRRPDANERAPALSFSIKPKDGQQLGKPHEDSAKTEQRFRESVKDAFGLDEIPF